MTVRPEHSGELAAVDVYLSRHVEDARARGVDPLSGAELAAFGDWMETSDPAAYQAALTAAGVPRWVRWLLRRTMR